MSRRHPKVPPAGTPASRAHIRRQLEQSSAQWVTMMFAAQYLAVDAHVLRKWVTDLDPDSYAEGLDCLRVSALLAYEKAARP
jgi:hypothetical protein